MPIDVLPERTAHLCTSFYLVGCVPASRLKQRVLQKKREQTKLGKYRTKMSALPALINDLNYFHRCTVIFMFSVFTFEFVVEELIKQDEANISPFWALNISKSIPCLLGPPSQIINFLCHYSVWWKICRNMSCRINVCGCHSKDCYIGLRAELQGRKNGQVKTLGGGDWLW